MLLPDRRSLAFAAALVLGSAQAFAAGPCGICATTVITNSSLADCFLERFPSLAKEDGAAVAVDLSDCPAERGIVQPLPLPGGEQAVEPDTQFLLSRAQLDCLKSKLEAPGVVLDPQARIDLGSCG